MSVLYNEFDPKVAKWLRELSHRNLINPGTIDDRSITDVQAADLLGYTQCHFFAGIGVWSHALRLAGWPDDAPVWTGSCPCQPFAMPGAQGGFDDERHLWPEWFRLIKQCRPPIIFGEQVESPAAFKWLDLVSSDLESEGYAIGASDLPAAGVGAPHIRQRLYFVAYSLSERHSLKRLLLRAKEGRTGSQEVSEASGRGEADIVADSDMEQRNGRGPARRGRTESANSSLVDYAISAGLQGHAGNGNDGDESGRLDAEAARPAPPSGCTSGFWGNAEWLYCSDGKYRAVEPGLSPMVAGTPTRVVRLRGYGNSIVAPLAQAFIEASIDAILDCQ